MTGGNVIAIGFLTFVVLVTFFMFWAWTNMGDCPPDGCNRPWWLDPSILIAAIAIWLLGIRQILRKKA